MAVKLTPHPNVVLLARAAGEIGALLDKVVFVGGATTTLYLTNQSHVPHARGTVDVDMILNANRAVFYDAEKFLRGLGFQNDKKLICRFTKADLVVDLLPTDESILGFSNHWYAEGFKMAEQHNFANHTLRVLSFPYFLATKLEAFNGRGKGDYLGSKDIEDVITVLAGRRGFLLELVEIRGELRKYLQREFKNHLANEHFLDAMNAHVPRIDGITQRTNEVLADLREFAASQGA